MEEEEDAFATLLVEGRYEECLKCCKGYLTALTDVSQSRGLRPSVDFDRPPKEMPRKYRVCLTFLQCIYELAPENSNVYLEELESFFAQNAPIPFLLARTWIQLKVSLQQFESSKELLLAYLGSLAESASQDARESFSEEKRSMYADLASLYIVHTLPGLNQLEIAQNFLAMHTNSALLTTQQRNQISVALDEVAHEKGMGGANMAAEASISNGVDAQNANGLLPDVGSPGTNGETNLHDTSISNSAQKHPSPADGVPKGTEVVVSVEHIAVAAAATAFAMTMVLKRKSIGNFVSRATSTLGDVMFGS
mmetsp:Transcript_6824/g.7830  ORF Transcript_6824/g.7830 Transcript_6824/m.7830 type:complete len:308 (-) Transcript_6824:1483-2406(-)